MRKSIWLICKYASPEKYFFGTRHFYFAEEWVKYGHEVIIFTSNASHLTDKLPQFSESRMVEEIQGVRTVWLKVLKTTKSSSAVRFLSWIHFEWKVLTTSKKRFKRPDVIITKHGLFWKFEIFGHYQLCNWAVIVLGIHLCGY